MSPTTLIIHCSATPDGRHHTARDIDLWHQQRGFRRMESWRRRHRPDLGHLGYHWVIALDGTVESGRAIGEVGAHTLGRNVGSVGACLIGTSRFTMAQWKALADLMRAAQQQWPGIAVHGHRHFAPKLCPGFDVALWLEELDQPLDGHVLDNRRTPSGTY